MQALEFLNSKVQQVTVLINVGRKQNKFGDGFCWPRAGFGCGH